MQKPTIIEQLKRADREHYAIPHFNYSDVWDMTAIVRAAEEERSPVILAGVPKVTNALGMALCGAMGRAMMEEARVPVYHHLDHSTDVNICKAAVDQAFPMVMLDGSRESLERNIESVREVADYAHPRGAFVEGEIGRIKGASVESTFDGEDFLVKVDEAVALVERSGVDILAVGVGTAHGFYQGKPEINFRRLQEVNEALDIPLVLHGGTGIPDDMIAKAISLGVSKININTECQLAFAEATRKYIEAGKDIQGKGFDPRKLLAPGAKAIEDKCKEKIELFGCAGKG